MVQGGKQDNAFFYSIGGTQKKSCDASEKRKSLLCWFFQNQGYFSYFFAIKEKVGPGSVFIKGHGSLTLLKACNKLLYSISITIYKSGEKAHAGSIILGLKVAKKRGKNSTNLKKKLCWPFSCSQVHWSCSYSRRAPAGTLQRSPSYHSTCTYRHLY